MTEKCELGDEKTQQTDALAHTSPALGIATVELLGFPRTEPTARSRDALRSFSSFVCCASLRSFYKPKHDNNQKFVKKKMKSGRTLFDDRCKCTLFCIAF